MRVLRVLEQLDKVKYLPGDVIELGVAYGTVTFPMSHILEVTPEKKIYSCDTFEGMPYDDSMGPVKRVK